MFPLIASLFGSALGPTPPLQVGGIPPPPPTSPAVIIGVLVGVGLVGGLIYMAVRE